MVRVMVKDGKRIFLEIGDDICRYYPNKKECREFRLQDIAVVERMEIALDSEVILRDAGGKILANFLMSMKNGSAAMRFFRDCNQGKLIDEYGKLLPQFEIIVTKKPETEEQKERSEENRRTKKKRDGLREEWAKAPLFYETAAWKKRIKRMSRALTLLSIILSVYMTTVTYDTASFLYIVYPVLVWVFYLYFHRVFVWDVLHPLEENILPPFVSLILLSFVIVLRDGQYNLAAGSFGKSILFRVILAAILLCPFLVQWYQEKGCLEWKAPVAYVLAYSLLAMMSWNVIFTVSEPKYEQAILTDKEKKVHWHGGRRSVNYYFTGETADGEQIWGSVAGIYDQAEVGDPIWICQYESLFGIEYFEFQIPK